VTVVCETGEGCTTGNLLTVQQSYDKVINVEGRISECVKDRIQIGNRAYAANHHKLKSKIIKRSVKMQIYKTLIRPVVMYGSEIWTLTKSDENLLRIFERKILRRIYGPVQGGGGGIFGELEIMKN
jgi:hypothetical protein